MLFLNKTDIAGLDRTLIQGAVRRAYSLMLDNDYNMPDRIHVHDKDNTFLLMPCFSGAYLATKLVSVFPGAAQKGLPVVNGVMILNDNETGQPLAFMDGAALTAERTGAVGGLGVDLLTPRDITRAGIFGAGVQSRSQVRYLLLNRPVQQVAIADLHKPAVTAMIQELSKEFPKINFVPASSPESLVEEAEVIIAATTTKVPLFRNDPGLVKGKTFISIGSFLPDMKEFPDAVIEGAAQVFVDTPFAAKESGDICQPLAQGKVALEKIQPFASLLRTPVSPNEMTTLFFKSVGMALFDLCASVAVYEAALTGKLGKVLDF